MKSRSFAVGVTAALLVFMLAPASGSVRAADPDPKDVAIDNGLAWLVAQQETAGNWSPNDCDTVAITALAIVKLETRAIELGLAPLDPAYEYHANVQSGLDYLAGYAVTIPISVQPAGDPDGDGDGIGVYFQNCNEFHQIYTTSLALMALSASGDEAAYGALAQDTLDFLAYSQQDATADACNVHRGGWRYYDTPCWSDNSNTGWVTLGLGYARAAPPFGFGLTIPPFVLDELDIWLGVIQDPVDGDADDGGSWYDPDNWPWVNILKTGNLLYEFALVGDLAGTRVQDAVDYVERHWADGNSDPGWGQADNPANYHAMFTTMKGFEAQGIDLIDLDGDGTPEHDWFAEFAAVLVAQQNADGSWPWCYWSNDVVCTTWALMTLEKAVPPPVLAVPVDVKPGSCPNAIGVTSKGVLPVAILGSADLDVTQIDPASVYLYVDSTQVPPLRWSMSDTATPYQPFLDKPLDRMACTMAGPDGYLDLVLQFSTPAVAAMLGSVMPGDTLKLFLAGNLMEEFGGTPIMGEDVIWITPKG